MSAPWGAPASDWDHFDLILGLTKDLLPVVSNINATISPNSKMKDIGKVPSTYNGEGHVMGLGGWTSRKTTSVQIQKWKQTPDLGMCCQLREARALDNDINDPVQSKQVEDMIDTFLPGLPTRRRSNSAKSLKMFRMEGDIPKRVIRTAHGIIEFLATGQQCIVSGTHPSGVRYEWDGGLPDELITLSLAQFDLLWRSLEQKFGVEPAKTAKVSSKASKMAGVHEQDPTAKYLIDEGWVKSTERDGRLHIRCPFEEHHTSDTGDSSTTYWPANTGGYAMGHFKCLHAHCEERTDEEYKVAVGIAEDDFEDLTVALSGEYIAVGDLTYPELPLDMPWRPVQVAVFADRPAPRWKVKNIIPDAGLVVMFGDSGSGKSFIALDIAFSIARGIPWAGNRVQKGRVVYIAAEGAGGVTLRAKAYATQHGLNLAEIDLFVIEGAPNLAKGGDPVNLRKALKAIGGVSLIIVDTWAQTTPGANENSGEDMGKALGHCREMHEDSGATVMLLHHCGKDASRGARGWSGLRAAADAELSVTQNGNERVMAVTKQKDGETGGFVGFRLTQVPVGMDEDGEVTTSCIVTLDETIKLESVRKGKALGGAQERVKDILAMMFEDSGEWPMLEDLRTKVRELLTEEGSTFYSQNFTRDIKKLGEAGVLIVQTDSRVEILSV